MFEKITGYTDIIEMIRNINGIAPASVKLARRTGNTEDNTMVMINTILTKISGIQPLVIFFDALWHNGQTKQRKYMIIAESSVAWTSTVSDQCNSLSKLFTQINGGVIMQKKIEYVNIMKILFVNFPFVVTKNSMY
jgi:hypothetical protein